MMETKDFISALVGLALVLMGLFPLLATFKIGPSWFALKFLPVTIISWVVAVGALYLVVNSVIEITNSASIGYISIITAFVCLVIGVLPLLASFKIGPAWFALGFLKSIGPILYNIVLMAEGIFLMIAMVAMEM